MMSATPFATKKRCGPRIRSILMLVAVVNAVVRNSPSVLVFAFGTTRTTRRTRSSPPLVRGSGCEKRGSHHPQRSTRAADTTRLDLSLPMEVPVVGDLVSTYGYCLKYHYFPTQSVTNAVLTVVGDGIAQTVEAGETNGSNKSTSNAQLSQSVSSYDPKRGLVYFFKGLGSGIFWAWWFDFAEVWSAELTQSVLSHATGGFGLDGDAAGVDAITCAVRTAINIALEQFLVAPFVFAAWDIPVTAAMRGSPPDQIFPGQIVEKLPPLFVANARVWTPVNVVTYNLPLEYRLPFTSAASIVSESINAGITSKQPAQAVPPVVLPEAGGKLAMANATATAAATT